MAITTDITYLNAYRADNLGDVKPKILIGGTTKKFVPNTNISFECESGQEKFFLNLNRSSVTVDKEASALVSDKLALMVGNETDIWHIDEKGRLKWDIEFAQKPATNKFSWTLTHSEGLEFLYQPALTQEEIDKGVIRPDDVVGSYAVYCNKSGHYKDASGNTIVNYRAGKLLHIYRPLCIDAKGNKEWAELLIGKGTLTITIPQKYLDTAVYPMTLDPNVGYTSAGASAYSLDANNLYGLKASSPGSDGSGNSISISCASFWDNTYFKGVLIDHDNSDTITTNGIGSAILVPNDETQAWRTSSFATSPNIDGSTSYYPSFIIGSNCVVYYDTLASCSCLDRSNSYATPQNTGGWTYENSSERWSIYYTYTEGGSTIWKSQRRKYQHLVVR